MTANSHALRTAILLVRIEGLLWLAFAILTAAGANPGIPDTPMVRWSIGLLSGAGGLGLLLLAALLQRRSRVGYVATLALLTVVAFSMLADQFGLADLLVLALTVAPLVLLIKSRAAFFKHRADPQPESQGV
jgi:hypothetical protein